ncbi:uncharacterized protein FMAN_16010 [Fusarium mangiferae]|uniref:C2H2-type domain-containing protein n=1 Tax=Fusarium mangiferae TaxID=192010 RepID=A0A1L7UHY1_FUSMA|nr:uncharacterized protein FMAN_11722 [Fusarium mangiferae]XP_041691324.1 uncharacterized protein FMAN_16010 [Fusarium mangiferae]CVK97728.1 uncharacterized protein FMAN_11722 [Fusarium mangiferae]CVL08822.1 uncharacterized protein FMAN_16010 [Fusarium mangiferae]
MSQPSAQPSHSIHKPSGKSKSRIHQVNKDIIQEIRNKNLNTTLYLTEIVSNKVKSLRRRVWDDWVEYIKSSDLDSDKIWKEFCEGSTESIQEFRGFLEYYIVTSTKLVPCLGPEEYEEERTVKSAGTIQDVWCALVHVADEKILANIRQQFPAHKQLYMLKYRTDAGGRGHGPAADVGKLIPGLAIIHNLSRTQLFDKKEMTLQDLLMVLRTVWQRASYITCQPNQRLSFSAMLIMGGIGGWRYESLKKLTYRDIELGWLRDPQNPQKARCVATVRIHHVKRKTDAIERDQTSSFTFGITLVPFKPVCLLTHIVAMAFFRNAFSTKFTTPEDILFPKPDSEVDYVPLSWKDDIKDEPVFKLGYNLYWKLWHRVLLVGGLRENPRPYSVRVGAGNRLDGVLTSALRGYVFGNTDAVFRKSYLPADMRDDLMGIAYGEVSGKNEATVSFLHQTFTKRDQSAPVYITEEEYQSFENRRDIKEWRQQRLSLPCSSTESKALLGRIQHVKNVLERKLLEQRRKEYFEKADQLRSLGQSTSHLHQTTMVSPRFRQNQSSSKAAEQLAPYFIAEDSNYTIASKIVRYLRQAPNNNDTPDNDTADNYIADNDIADNDTTDGESTDTEAKSDQDRSICLLCFKDFSSRNSLSAHVQNVHLNDLESPIHCLECKHQGQEKSVPAGFPAWSSHTERYHGAKNSPIQAKRPALCLLCNKTLTIAGFSIHLNKAHGSKFAAKFQCPACLHHSLHETIDGKDDWISHVRAKHIGCRIGGAVLIGVSNTPAERDDNGSCMIGMKRKLEGKEETVQKRLRTNGSIFGVDRGIEEEEFWCTGRDEDYLDDIQGFY